MTQGEFWRLKRVIARCLYIPDGLAPQRIKSGTWSALADWRLAKLLVARYGEHEVTDAIQGLAVLRDAGALDWAKPGAKMTLRALYVKSGCEEIFHLARYSYRQSLKSRARPTPGLGELLYGQGM